MPNLNQDDPALKIAHDHAWDWFSLHANQRMQAFNFFLVVMAFLFAAYAALLEKNPVASAAIGLTGAWLTVWFSRLDARTRQLVKAGEKALAVTENLLAQWTGDELKIVEAVEKAARGTVTYGVSISIIQWTAFLAFIGGAAYAAGIAYWPTIPSNWFSPG